MILPMLHHKTWEAANAIEHAESHTELDTLNQRKSFVHKPAEQFSDVGLLAPASLRKLVVAPGMAFKLHANLS